MRKPMELIGMAVVFSSLLFAGKDTETYQPPPETCPSGQICITGYDFTLLMDSYARCGRTWVYADDDWPEDWYYGENIARVWPNE